MTEERITSRKNPLLQQVKKLLSSKKERENAGLFVADGTKLLQEAVKLILTVRLLRLLRERRR
mgnify:CR=1 FL=1